MYFVYSYIFDSPPAFNISITVTAKKKKKKSMCILQCSLSYGCAICTMLKHIMEVTRRNNRCHLNLLLLIIAILHRCTVGSRVWSGISKAVESQMQLSQWKASTTTSEQVREKIPLSDFFHFLASNLSHLHDRRSLNNSSCCMLAISFGHGSDHGWELNLPIDFFPLEVIITGAKSK